MKDNADGYLVLHIDAGTEEKKENIMRKGKKG